MSGRTTGAHKLIFANAWPEEDELGEGVGAEIDDKGEQFQAVGGRLGSAFESSKDLTAALTRISLSSPPGSKGKDSLVGLETASESVPSTSFALLFSGVVGALPRLVAVANGGGWETASVAFRQNSSLSSVSS